MTSTVVSRGVAKSTTVYSPPIAQSLFKPGASQRHPEFRPASMPLFRVCRAAERRRLTSGRGSGVAHSTQSYARLLPVALLAAEPVLAALALGVVRAIFPITARAERGTSPVAARLKASASVLA
jgi:hypothetical protein